MSDYANGGGEGNTGAVGNAPSHSGGGESNGGSASPWYAPLATGLEGPDAENFTSYASRYQDPQSFAKAVTNLRRSHDSRIPLPGPDAPEDAWGEVYTKLGRPSDPKEYKFNHVEGAPPLADVELEARENFRSVAYKLGLNQRQIDGLTQWNDNFRKTQYEAFDQAPKYAAEKTKEVLQSKYGPDTQRNLNVYASTVKAYAGEDIKSIATMRLDDGSFVMDHPAIVDMFVRIGLERAEDMRGTPMLGAHEAESIQNQIRALEQEAAEKGRLTSEEPYHSKLEPLYKKLYGKANLGGSGYQIR